MLTDRETIAIHLLSGALHTEWLSSIYLIKNAHDKENIAVRGVAKTFLEIADIFLEEARNTQHIDPIDLESLQMQNHLIAERIHKLVEINQQLATNNRALIELLSNIRSEEV